MKLPIMAQRVIARRHKIAGGAIALATAAAMSGFPAAASAESSDAPDKSSISAVSAMANDSGSSGGASKGLAAPKINSVAPPMQKSPIILGPLENLHSQVFNNHVPPMSADGDYVFYCGYGGGPWGQR